MCHRIRYRTESLVVAIAGPQKVCTVVPVQVEDTVSAMKRLLNPDEA